MINPFACCPYCFACCVVVELAACSFSSLGSYTMSALTDGRAKYSRSPDDDMFRFLSMTYSGSHTKMHRGEPCWGHMDTERFQDGIVNGAHWYAVIGEGLVSALCYHLGLFSLLRVFGVIGDLETPRLS